MSDNQATESKIKVLEISSGVFGVAGGPTMVWNWYCNWNAVQVDFYCLLQPSDYYIQKIATNGGSCYIRDGKKNKLRRKIAEWRQLKKILRGNFYDCVHIHREDACNNLVICLLAKNHVKKVIVHAHNTSTGSAIKRILHTICKPFLCSSKIVALACSNDAAAWLFPSKIIDEKRYTVIKNGIDAQRFSFDPAVRDKARTELGISGKFVIGHVGRFAYQKNHTFLIDIFAEVHKKCPEAVLLLIGDGDASENLVELIKKKIDVLGLSESVIFYGNTDRVNEMYQTMDCFVFPSNYEGLGIVAIEAQAAGLKTLCSDQVPQDAKITELLEYLPLSDPPEKWADKILTYKEYKRENMQQNIIDAGYDIKQSAKKLEEIYLASRC